MGHLAHTILNYFNFVEDWRWWTFTLRAMICTVCSVVDNAIFTDRNPIFQFSMDLDPIVLKSLSQFYPIDTALMLVLTLGPPWKVKKKSIQIGRIWINFYEEFCWSRFDKMMWILADPDPEQWKVPYIFLEEQKAKYLNIYRCLVGINLNNFSQETTDGLRNKNIFLTEEKIPRETMQNLTHGLQIIHLDQI
jgi:hypothetical protein